MSGSALKNEVGFSLLWKIKNFTCVFDSIDSPEFHFLEAIWYLSYNATDLECRLVAPPIYSTDFRLDYVLSFIPCDDSPPLSANGSSLKVSKEELYKTGRKAFLPEDTLTVQLRIPDSFPQNLYIQSEIGVKRKLWLWHLKDLEPFPGGDIEVKTTGNSDVYGKVEFRVKSIKEYVSNSNEEVFFFEVLRSSGGKLLCSFLISVLNNDYKVVKLVNDSCLFEKEGEWKSVPICDNSAEFHYLFRGRPTLLLKCEVSVTLGKVTDEVEVNSPNDLATLPDCWRNLLTSFKKENRTVSVSQLQSEEKTEDRPASVSEMQIDEEKESPPVSVIELSSDEKKEKPPVTAIELSSDEEKKNSPVTAIELSSDEEKKNSPVSVIELSSDEKNENSPIFESESPSVEKKADLNDSVIELSSDEEKEECPVSVSEMQIAKRKKNHPVIELELQTGEKLPPISVFKSKSNMKNGGL